MSPVTDTKVKLAIRLATRQSMLSAAMKTTRIVRAVQISPLCGPLPSASTTPLRPYCVLTEQATAPSTATMIAACGTARRRM
ncbi:hypothetical protein GMJLKIPL_0799 [Methylobacterium isbiliense]|uniref:Uncharacterized protein n=1 Tax=Methylobacterium isbiliense TaxID=315478 RepID=A0ABQ4S6S6_9HYPH|nr:hypothetical protein GMJLKIPL_0799 [Methylobacterium isbiliense]